MAVEEIILEKLSEKVPEKAREKKHIVLKHKPGAGTENAVVSPNRLSSFETPKQPASFETSNRPSSFETPRASSVSTTRSSVASSVKSTPASKPARNGPKYVSPMAKAREEKKRRESTSDNKSITSSDMESTSSNPSTESATSDTTSKRSGSEDKPGDKRGPTLPKFGEWNNHSADSGPCYTLLFQNAAQEKKTGGPVRIHAPRPPDSPARNDDLYAYNCAASVRIPRKQNQFMYGLLCCFKTSESS